MSQNSFRMLKHGKEPCSRSHTTSLTTTDFAFVVSDKLARNKLIFLLSEPEALSEIEKIVGSLPGYLPLLFRSNLPQRHHQLVVVWSHFSSIVAFTMVVKSVLVESQESLSNKCPSCNKERLQNNED